MMEKTKYEFSIQKYGALIVLLLLLTINVIITPNFTKVNTLWNIVVQAFPVIIVAIGMTLVISTGGIDISVGSILAICAMFFAKSLMLDEMSFGVAVLIAVIAALIFGLINGILIGFLNVQPIVATLIMMIAGRGVAQQLTEGGVVSFYGNDYVSLSLCRVWGVIPIQVFIIVGIVILAIFIIKKTAFGVYVQAVGDNHKASFVSGLNTKGVIVAVYVICALLACIVAIFECLRTGAADPTNFGRDLELDCIAAVAVGGTSMTGGKALIIGTVIGALVMQVISTMINMNDIHYTYSLMVKAVVIILALYLQNRKSAR